MQDTDDHQYAYNFDYDVMHPFMIKSFAPFFRPGHALELGCFKGMFTQRITDTFESLTCVEASGEALSEAKLRVGNKANYVHSIFETAELPQKYDNIFLTHVLEHCSDPVEILKRIGENWLSNSGYLFLACPNANAPSRQIAVKMGLIDHNSDVTPSEKEHGHFRTYTFDTLESEVRKSGLEVVHRGGIFFKALANFQWDQLLKTDIISKEYLQGCFDLGQEHPELCSSIYLVCKRK
jgi:2-polyprenyl-3-methyl-5-hydroxy-6-metoxy-1,4-benzoquinol methylase